MSEPPLVEAFDFVIVNAELHENFDAFKKAEVQPRFSYVPAIELVSFFCKCTNITSPCITRYESDYYYLDETQLDQLIVWAQELRQEYQSTGCVKLFRDEVCSTKAGKWYIQYSLPVVELVILFIIYPSFLQCFQM